MRSNELSTISPDDPAHHAGELPEPDHTEPEPECGLLLWLGSGITAISLPGPPEEEAA